MISIPALVTLPHSPVVPAAAPASRAASVRAPAAVFTVPASPAPSVLAAVASSVPVPPPVAAVQASPSPVYSNPIAVMDTPGPSPVSSYGGCGAHAHKALLQSCLPKGFDALASPAEALQEAQKCVLELCQACVARTLLKMMCMNIEKLLDSQVRAANAHLRLKCSVGLVYH